jgi:hypothetical protein
MDGRPAAAFERRLVMRAPVQAGLLIALVLLAAVSAEAGDKYYRRGLLVDILRGDQQSSTTYVSMPQELGGAQIPVTFTSTKYRVLVLVDDLIYEAETGWDKEPKGFVINDPVEVRLSNDGEKLYLRSPSVREYKTRVLRRQRAPSTAPEPVAVPEDPTPPVAPPAPPRSNTSNGSESASLRARCDADEWVACNDLGVLYMQGRGGVTKDTAQAARL